METDELNSGVPSNFNCYTKMKSYTEVNREVNTSKEDERMKSSDSNPGMVEFEVQGPCA